MKIAAFDIGTCTGVCVGNTHEKPTLHTIQFEPAGTDYGTMAHTARVRYLGFLKIEMPDEVWLEGPINNNTLQSFRILLGLTFTLYGVCKKLGIPVREAHNGSAKMALARHGHAQKVHMVQGAKLLGFNPKTPDSADAFAVWLCAIEERDPTSRKAWLARQQSLAFAQLIQDIVKAAKLRRAKNAETPKLPQSGKSNGRRQKRKVDRTKDDGSPGLF